MQSNEELEKRICELEARNKKVEMNKTWETSFTRRGFVALFTYLAIALYLKFVVGIDPWINAIVPTVGFLLSTLTPPYFKSVWEKVHYRK